MSRSETQMTVAHVVPNCTAESLRIIALAITATCYHCDKLDILSPLISLALVIKTENTFLLARDDKEINGVKLEKNISNRRSSDPNFAAIHSNNSSHSSICT